MFSSLVFITKPNLFEGVSFNGHGEVQTLGETAGMEQQVNETSKTVFNETISGFN